MGGSSGDEYGVAEALHDGVALDAVLLVQPHPERSVQVPVLIVDGVVVGLEAGAPLYSYFVEEISDFVRVPRIVDVPESAWKLALLPDSSPC